jgi:hypothetical protein
METFECYKAKTNYHRTDDLREGAAPNNTEMLVQVMWMSGEDDPFPDEWVFQPSRYMYWIPERDLEIIEEVSLEEYSKDRELGLL